MGTGPVMINSGRWDYSPSVALFTTQTIDNTQFLVSMAAEDFQGIARSNKKG
jgi:hypothetical protein